MSKPKERKWLRESVRAYKTRRTFKSDRQMKRESSIRGISFGRGFVWRPA